MSDGNTVISADWSAPEGIVAGCTTRIGGVSEGTFASCNLGLHVGDNAEHVVANRREFLQRCNLAGEPLWLNQVHGKRVLIDPSRDDDCTADAIVSRSAGAVCAVMVADCLPVLFASADGTEIGAAHAGWRGLCDGVLEQTVAALQAPAATLRVWLGPAISQPHFEVGNEVRRAFVAQDASAADCFEKNAGGRWHADLRGLARQRLERAGVCHIFGGEMCTYANPTMFFSYRRDGQCGRMAAFVAKVPA